MLNMFCSSLLFSPNNFIRNYKYTRTQDAALANLEISIYLEVEFIYIKYAMHCGQVNQNIQNISGVHLSI